MLRRFQLFRNIGNVFHNEITKFQNRSYETFGHFEDMPKSKEYLSSDDSDSSVEKAPKRKRDKEDKKSSADKVDKAESSKKPKTSSKDEDNKTSWDLGNNRVIAVREFKGKLLIDIREMYMDNNSGDMKPGKKGIALNPAQWAKLKECCDEVDKVVKNKC